MEKGRGGRRGRGGGKSALPTARIVSAILVGCCKAILVGNFADLEVEYGRNWNKRWLVQTADSLRRLKSEGYIQVLIVKEWGERIFDS